MTDLVDTTEMYLRTILDLEEEHIVPLRARISERLGHSGPTVSQTIARMERDGLVKVEGDRHLEFTAEGRSRAIHVMRKHRLAERLLNDVIGLDWAYVHDEACRWEHVMSEQVERRLLEMLGNPTESPYGNPIPGLDELGGAKAPAFMDGVINLVDRTAACRVRPGDRRHPASRRARAVRARTPPAAASRRCRARARRPRSRPRAPTFRCRWRASATVSNCPTRSLCTSSSRPDSRLTGLSPECDRLGIVAYTR